MVWRYASFKCANGNLSKNNFSAFSTSRSCDSNRLSYRHKTSTSKAQNSISAKTTATHSVTTDGEGEPQCRQSQSINEKASLWSNVRANLILANIHSDFPSTRPMLRVTVLCCRHSAVPAPTPASTCTARLQQVVWLKTTHTHALRCSFVIATAMPPKLRSMHMQVFRWAVWHAIQHSDSGSSTHFTLGVNSWNVTYRNSIETRERSCGDIWHER